MNLTPHPDPQPDDEGLQQLEHAEREIPVCRLCGARTAAVGHRDGSVWLECSSLSDHRPALARLFGVDFAGGHTRRLVIPARQAA